MKWFFCQQSYEAFDRPITQLASIEAPVGAFSVSEERWREQVDAKAQNKRDQGWK